MNQTDILSMTLPEIAEAVQSMGEKTYRAGQIYSWLHEKHVTSFGEMTSLSLSFRQRLAERFRIPPLSAVQCLTSQRDGTRKYAFELEDGNIIESVLMHYRYGWSVCISSQAGCRMGCAFCASTLEGLARNLLPSEMLGQVYRIEEDLGERISHVVVMGTGEPLDNLDSLIRFLRLLTDGQAGGISRRNITVSTCGLVPAIDRLAEENLGVSLALSLHAPTDELRRRLMPIAKVYPIAECLAACDRYFARTGRRITYEYSLMRGINDAPEQADQLGRLLRGRSCLVNLIPVNPVPGKNYKRSDPKRVTCFQKHLENYGINATIRRSMGSDIDSACGQLRRKLSAQRKEASHE